MPQETQQNAAREVVTDAMEDAALAAANMRPGLLYLGETYRVWVNRMITAALAAAPKGNAMSGEVTDAMALASQDAFDKAALQGLPTIECNRLAIAAAMAAAPEDSARNAAPDMLAALKFAADNYLVGEPWEMAHAAILKAVGLSCAICDAQEIGDA